MDAIMRSLPDPRNAALLGKIEGMPAEDYVSPVRAIGPEEIVVGEMSTFEKAAYTHCQYLYTRLYWNAMERDEILERSDRYQPHSLARTAVLEAEAAELRQEREFTQKILLASIWEKADKLNGRGCREVYPFLREKFTVTAMHG